MLYLYDKALENKFKEVFPRVVYAPVDKFYDRYLIGTKNSNGNTTTKPVQLPAISLFRTGGEFSTTNAITPMTTRNMLYNKELEKYSAKSLYSVQYPLTYQLDIWTSSDIDRDDLLKELIYFMVRYPNIVIEYKNLKFAFPIYVDSTDDATDIASFENTGDIYRQSMMISVPDSRLMYSEDTDLLKYLDISVIAD